MNKITSIAIFVFLSIAAANISLISYSIYKKNVQKKEEIMIRNEKLKLEIEEIKDNKKKAQLEQERVEREEDEKKRNKYNKDIIEPLILFMNKYESFINYTVELGKSMTNIDPVTEKLYGKEVVTDYNVPSEIYEVRKKFQNHRNEIASIKSDNPEIQKIKNDYLNALDSVVQGIGIYIKGLYTKKKDYVGEFEHGTGQINYGVSLYYETLIDISKMFYKYKDDFTNAVIHLHPLYAKYAYYKSQKSTQADYVKYLQNANLFYENKDYESAIYNYLIAFMISPSSSEALSKVAYTSFLSDRSRRDYALDLFTSLIRDFPKNANGYFGKAICLYDKASTFNEDGALEYDIELVKESLEVFEKGKGLWDGETSDLCDIAFWWMAEASMKIDVNKSASLYQEYYEIFKAPKALYEMGKKLSNAGYEEKAVNAYKKYLNILDNKKMINEADSDTPHKTYRINAENYIKMHSKKA